MLIRLCVKLNPLYHTSNPSSILPQMQPLSVFLRFLSFFCHYVQESAKSTSGFAFTIEVRKPY